MLEKQPQNLKTQEQLCKHKRKHKKKKTKKLLEESNCKTKIKITI